MNQLQKMGGIAALYEAAAYIIGIVFFLVVMDYTQVSDPIQRVALLVDNQFAISSVTLLIYVIFSIFLVILVLALHQRLKASLAIMQVATAFGLIWAGVVMASGMIFNIGLEAVAQLYSQDPTQAATVWLAISTVTEGLGGGVEVLGGLWLVLLSWAALQTRGLPKSLNYYGMVIGLAGMITVIPALGELGGLVFGLGQIPWFVWLGIVMFQDTATQSETTVHITT